MQVVTWTSEIYKSEILMTPSLVWLICYKVSQNWKEDFCFLDYWFIMRRYNSWAARWKRHIAQGMEKDVEFSSSLWVSQFPQMSTSFNKLEALWTCPLFYFCFVFFLMEASLHRHEWLNHWPLAIDSNFKPSPFPWGGVWNLKVQPSDHEVPMLKWGSKVISLI